MATKTRPSTTPTAQKQKEAFSELDKKYPTKTIARADVARLICQECNTRPQCELSTYAVSRDAKQIFVSCRCKGKKVWLKLID